MVTITSADRFALASVDDGRVSYENTPAQDNGTELQIVAGESIRHHT